MNREDKLVLTLVAMFFIFIFLLIGMSYTSKAACIETLKDKTAAEIALICRG